MIRLGKPNPIYDLFPPKSAGFITAKVKRETQSSPEGIEPGAPCGAPPATRRLDARIASYELAAKLQMSAPEVLDLSGESEATKKLYGLDEKFTEDFGQRCLTARRLLERGVRFVQVWSGAAIMVFHGATGTATKISPATTSIWAAAWTNRPQRSLKI